jgi:protein-S-isoprenylcysteine O-methyltransferase Ste14
MRRALVLVFGLVAYAAFGLVFAAMAAFLANAGLWRDIDGLDRVASQGEGVVVNFGLLGLFGVTHSVMARPWFKERWTRIVPVAAERSAYVLVASLCLGLLVWQWRASTVVIWHVESPALRVAIWAVSAIGVALIVVSTFLTSHVDLFGLRQVWLHARGVPYTPVPFREWFLYRYMRHPMMVGVLLWAWATPSMSGGHVIFAGGMTAYIVIGVAYEERDLARNLGAPYESYRARVRAFLPIRKR